MSEEDFPDRRLVERRRSVLMVDADAEADPQHPLSASARRSGRDRRSGDRRARGEPVTAEKRSGTDRRAQDRRNGADRRRRPDRRRETPAAFSREEAGQICHLARTSGATLVCPRCRGRLLLRPPVDTVPESVWQVRCLTCHRCVMIKNL